MNDPYRLERFLNAQSVIIEQVRSELRAGRKRTHWIWFVFPQLAGLGSSTTARLYAIASMDEARAYLAQPILGPRLIECVSLVNAVNNRTALDIFDAPDHLKFHSSMTLFSLADPYQPSFRSALDKFFDKRLDPLTVELLT